MCLKYVEDNIIAFIKDPDRRTETFDDCGIGYVTMMKKTVGEYTDAIFCGVIGNKRDELVYLNSELGNLRFCGLYSYSGETLITYGDLVKMRGFTQYNTYKQWMSAKVNDLICEIVDGKPVSEEYNKPEHNLPEIDDGTVEAKAVFLYFSDEPASKMDGPVGNFSSKLVRNADIVYALEKGIDQWASETAETYVKEYAKAINRTLAFNMMVLKRYNELTEYDDGKYYHKRNIIRSVKKFINHNKSAKLFTVTVNDGINEFTGKMDSDAFSGFVAYDRSGKSHVAFDRAYFVRKYKEEYKRVIGENHLIPASWITRITHGKYEVYSKEGN